MGVPLLRTLSRGRFLLCFGGAVSFVRSITGGPVTSTSESSAVRSMGLDITRRVDAVRAAVYGVTSCCSAVRAPQPLFASASVAVWTSGAPLLIWAALIDVYGLRGPKNRGQKQC